MEDIPYIGYYREFRNCQVIKDEIVSRKDLQDLDLRIHYRDTLDPYLQLVSAYQQCLSLPKPKPHMKPASIVLDSNLNFIRSRDVLIPYNDNIVVFEPPE